jgi:hypothetical protein
MLRNTVDWATVNPQKIWYVRTADGIYLGAVRGATKEEALEAARKRWLAEDPLPWQYPISTVLEVQPFS